MKLKLILAALATTALLSVGIAKAEPASTPGTAQTPPSATAKGPRSAKSIECSKQADAKGLHGKERRKFRRQCLRS
jgi:psiF repeat